MVLQKAHQRLSLLSVRLMVSAWVVISWDVGLAPSSGCTFSRESSWRFSPSTPPTTCRHMLFTINKSLKKVMVFQKTVDVVYL